MTKEQYRDYMREYMREYRKHMPDFQKEQFRETSRLSFRLKRARRRKQGLCTNCGGPRSDDIHLICARCREYKRESARRRRDKKKEGLRNDL